MKKYIYIIVSYHNTYSDICNATFLKKDKNCILADLHLYKLLLIFHTEKGIHNMQYDLHA